MVNDGTESIDLKCEKCMHCTRMEVETFCEGPFDVYSEWMCECFDGSWHPRSDDSDCCQYVEDNTRND